MANTNVLLKYCSVPSHWCYRVLLTHCPSSSWAFITTFFFLMWGSEYPPVHWLSVCHSQFSSLFASLHDFIRISAPSHEEWLQAQCIKGLSQRSPLSPPPSFSPEQCRAGTAGPDVNSFRSSTSLIASPYSLRLIPRRPLGTLRFAVPYTSCSWEQ